MYSYMGTSAASRRSQGRLPDSADFTAGEPQPQLLYLRENP